MRKHLGPRISALEYTRVIGSLTDLRNCTRPDIAYVVGRHSRYTSNPNSKHYDTLVWVLRYLKYTLNWEIHYTELPIVLERYCDANDNWILDTNESKSTSGYVFTLADVVVFWKSTKQSIVKSTMKFITLDKAGEQVKEFLYECYFVV